MNTENTDLETLPTEEGRIDEFADKPRPEPPKPPKPPEPAAETREAKPAKRGGSFLAFLAFVISLAAAGLAGWTWWQAQQAGSAADSQAIAEVARLDAGQDELSLKFNQLRNELDTLASGDVSAEFEALQRRIESDRRQMAEVEQAMQEQLALSRSLQAATESMQGRLRAAEAAVSGMSTRELDAGGELDLAEVDYLLRLANERLKLFSDPVAADEALEVADMHLAALDNPMYLGVRQEIAAARRSLTEVEMPAWLDIASSLDDIQAAVPGLVFLDDEAPVAETAVVEEEGWWGSVKGAFSSLVTVRRSTEQENERISLEDMDYVRQRIWLQMEIAHLALMRQEQTAFRSSLARTSEAITAWFDPAAGTYREVVEGIDELMAVNIDVEVPDITAPWSTLRLLRNSAPAVPVAAPAAEAVEEAVEEAEDKDTEAGDETG